MLESLVWGLRILLTSLEIQLVIVVSCWAWLCFVLFFSNKNKKKMRVDRRECFYNLADDLSSGFLWILFFLRQIGEKCRIFLIFLFCCICFSSFHFSCCSGFCFGFCADSCSLSLLKKWRTNESNKLKKVFKVWWSFCCHHFSCCCNTVNWVSLILLCFISLFLTKQYC